MFVDWFTNLITPAWFVAKWSSHPPFHINWPSGGTDTVRFTWNFTQMIIHVSKEATQVRLEIMTILSLQLCPILWNLASWIFERFKHLLVNIFLLQVSSSHLVHILTKTSRINFRSNFWISEIFIFQNWSCACFWVVGCYLTLGRRKISPNCQFFPSNNGKFGDVGMSAASWAFDMVQKHILPIFGEIFDLLTIY